MTKCTVDERLALIRRVGEEIIGEEELKALLEGKQRFVAYDGFEPSGRIHIAQAILRAINVNRMTMAGADFTMFVADWHAWANNKLGGDLERIQTTGKYFIEVWKASGMDLKHVEFVWASDLVKDDAYWRKVMQVATATTLKRVLRTTQIMGRSESDALQASQILYPCMQAADIFYLKADVCQLGMDQRKVNVLARELAEKLGHTKPIVVSHHMLMGLSEPPQDLRFSLDLDAFNNKSKFKYYTDKNEYILEDTTTNQKVSIRKGIKEYRYPEGSTINVTSDSTFPSSLRFEYKVGATERAMAMKMSKSKPDTAIFVTDTKEEVERKLKKAYCPEGQAEENPILEYCRYLIFAVLEEKGEAFVIERPEKFGGTVSFKSYTELERAFVAKSIHPMDLKAATGKYVNRLLEPIRKHFAEDEEARRLKDLVESYQVTR